MLESNHRSAQLPRQIDLRRGQRILLLDCVEHERISILRLPEGVGKQNSFANTLSRTPGSTTPFRRYESYDAGEACWNEWLLFRDEYRTLSGRF